MNETKKEKKKAVRVRALTAGFRKHLTLISDRASEVLVKQFKQGPLPKPPNLYCTHTIPTSALRKDPGGEGFRTAFFGLSVLIGILPTEEVLGHNSLAPPRRHRT